MVSNFWRLSAPGLDGKLPFYPCVRLGYMEEEQQQQQRRREQIQTKIIKQRRSVVCGRYEGADDTQKAGEPKRTTG